MKPMRITVKSWRNDDCNLCEKISINGEEVLDLRPCEPEDAILERDLLSSVDLIPLFRKIYDASKDIDAFIVERIEIDSNED